VAKIRHFAKEKCPKQHGQGFQNSKKNYILRKKVLKSPRFLEDLGGFLAFSFEITIFT
jgi:hypothetical protein